MNVAMFETLYRRSGCGSVFNFLQSGKFRYQEMHLSSGRWTDGKTIKFWDGICYPSSTLDGASFPRKRANASLYAFTLFKPGRR